MELVPNEIISPVFILWALNSWHKLRHCYSAVKIVSKTHFLFQDFNIAELPESNRAICVVEIFIMPWGEMILTKLPANCMLYTNQTNKRQHNSQEEKQVSSFYFFLTCFRRAFFKCADFTEKNPFLHLWGEVFYGWTGLCKNRGWWW